MSSISTAKCRIYSPETEAMIPDSPNWASDDYYFSLYGPNQYPESVPGFKEAILAHRENCLTVAEKLISVIASSLTPKPELLTSIFLPSTNKSSGIRKECSIPAYSRMKVVRYPPVTAQEDGLGVGEHRDGGGLTLLAQDNSGGLQVQLWDGQWIDVPPVNYALVINVGQVLENMSSNFYPATTHRVLKTVRDTPRISVPYFYSPRLDAQLEPLKTSDLHADLQALNMKQREVKSDVPFGDLHEKLFGVAAWRGITRSHREVFEKYYGDASDRYEKARA